MTCQQATHLTRAQDFLVAAVTDDAAQRDHLQDAADEFHRVDMVHVAAIVEQLIDDDRTDRQRAYEIRSLAQLCDCWIDRAEGRIEPGRRAMPDGGRSEAEINHHAARLTAKVIDADAHTVLKTWVDGLDSDEDVEEVVDRIYGAAEAEIVETLEQEGVEADMDDNEPRYVTDGGQPDGGIEQNREFDPEIRSVGDLLVDAYGVEGAISELAARRTDDEHDADRVTEVLAYVKRDHAEVPA